MSPRLARPILRTQGVGVEHSLSSVEHTLTTRVSGKRDDVASASAVVAEHDLPTMLNRFVGRERELAELVDLSAHARLLTLTGPGGVGKTRLAVRLAEASRLGSSTVSRSSTRPGRSGQLGQPARRDRARLAPHVRPQTLADAIGNRQLLLVLDNCSREVDLCAELAVTLLSTCPRLQILATSIERLGVPGEMLWQVPPLSVPEPR